MTPILVFKWPPGRYRHSKQGVGYSIYWRTFFPMRRKIWPSFFSRRLCREIRSCSISQYHLLISLFVHSNLSRGFTTSTIDRIPPTSLNPRLATTKVHVHWWSRGRLQWDRRIFIWRLISLRAHSIRRTWRNALSILILTLSFSCSFGNKADPMYLNNGILDSLAVDETFLSTWHLEGREGFCFLRVGFQVDFCWKESTSAEYCLHGC